MGWEKRSMCSIFLLDTTPPFFEAASLCMVE